MPEDDYFHNDPNVFYTETNVVGEDTETIAIGCTCSENSQCQNENESCQCIEMSGGILNYTSDGKLIVKENPIFECRPLCQCVNCSNRVVQNGPVSGLVVQDFGTKGLGLICQTPISKGTFVCEYAGELLSVQIAKERSKKDKMNYILYIVENFKNEKRIFAIDPTIIGNIGRYINHSCDPNLSKHLVRVDTMHPRVALVAEKDIAAGTELTFDYGSQENKYSSSNTEESIPRKKCHCKSEKCQGFLPFYEF